MLCFFALFWFLCKMPATIFFSFFSILYFEFILVTLNQFTSSLTDYEMVRGLLVFGLFVYAPFWSLLCLGSIPTSWVGHLGWDVLERTSYTTFHTNENFWMPVLLCNPSTLSWRVFVVSHVSAVWSHSSFVLGFLFTCEDGWFRLVGWWAMVCRRFKKFNIEGWVGADAPEIKKTHYNLPLKYHPDKT